MAGSKREKDLARAKAQRQAARRAAAEEQRRQRNRIVAGATVAVIVLGAIVWFVLANRGSESNTATSPATFSASPTPSVSGSASGSAAPAINCAQPAATRADNLSWPKPPEQKIDTAKRYAIDFTTNCGQLTIETLPKLAPKTVNSMVFLTENKYFDGTKCHRLTTEGIFVLQCGDPKGDGTGGPGYSIPDENLPTGSGVNYPAGTVAMANAGANTGGSQFFIVYKDTTLPPSYTIWGKLTKGLDIVQGIAAAGVEGGGTDGPPAQPVTIEKGSVLTS